MAAADEPLGAIVVGCGGVGSRYDEDGRGAPVTHASAYAAHPRSTLLAGVDPDAARRSSFEAARGVPCYATLGEALAAGTVPLLASVCSPPDSHLPVARELLEGGVRALWCEKPLAATPEEGRALIGLCDEHGAALQLNFLRRFDHLHQEVAREVSGEQFHADFRFSGGISNYGSHAFDLFRWFAGPVAWVRAIPIGNGEPAVLAAAQSGSTATFLQIRNPAADVFDAVIHVRDSRIAISCLGEERARATPQASELFRTYVSLPWGEVEARGGLKDSMLTAVTNLIEHIRAGRELACAGEEGLAALEMEAAVTRSLATGGSERLAAL